MQAKAQKIPAARRWSALAAGCLFPVAPTNNKKVVSECSGLTRGQPLKSSSPHIAGTPGPAAMPDLTRKPVEEDGTRF